MTCHRSLFTAAAACAVAAIGAGPASAVDHHMEEEAPAPEATATLLDADGNEAGMATFTQTPNGVLIKAEIAGLSEGVHGFHIHETGACAPEFSAAGGHFAPLGNDHGALTPEGLHAGDMPNIHVGESGEIIVERLNANISVGDEEEPGYLFDADGSALVIHANADDYESQPSGDAGNRVACGVIELK